MVDLVVLVPVVEMGVVAKAPALVEGMDVVLGEVVLVLGSVLD